MLDQAGFTRTGTEVALRAPLSEADVRALKVGDLVMISGRMFTGRDAVHSYLMKHEPPVDLRGSVLYHCGPVVAKEGDGWRITAAGPTTSIREEPYQGEIIKRYGVRVVIGKGGMGAKTLAALKEQGAVYLNAIGGAAQFYARSIKKVDGVSLLDFGTPEAMWHLDVEDFPAIVTMDAHGNSLHKDIEQESGQHSETIGGGCVSRGGRRPRPRGCRARCRLAACALAPSPSVRRRRAASRVVRRLRRWGGVGAVASRPCARCLGRARGGRGRGARRAASPVGGVGAGGAAAV